MKRARVTVRWDRAMKEWRVSSGLILPTFWFTKDAAMRDGRCVAKDLAPSELVIYGKNGRIQDARSYGTDPGRSKG